MSVTPEASFITVRTRSNRAWSDLESARIGGYQMCQTTVERLFDRMWPIQITLHERVLTISGECRAEEQREGSGYYVRERRYGSFRRSLVLPHDVEEGQISARFEDGVLEVRVPGGATELVPKRIEIQGPSGEGTGG